MNSINIETHIAHSIGISDSYYRATEEEILQDYLKGESYLTINVESELREQLQNGTGEHYNYRLRN